MAQSVITARVDSQDKIDFDNFCQNVGMNTSTAINMFVKVVVRENRLPFSVGLDNEKAKKDGLNAFMQIRQMAENEAFPDLTEDEINSEIQTVRNKN